MAPSNDFVVKFFNEKKAETKLFGKKADRGSTKKTYRENDPCAYREFTNAFLLLQTGAREKSPSDFVAVKVDSFKVLNLRVALPLP
jgi:hypothetical protein